MGWIDVQIDALVAAELERIFTRLDALVSAAHGRRAERSVARTLRVAIAAVLRGVVRREARFHVELCAAADSAVVRRSSAAAACAPDVSVATHARVCSGAIAPVVARSALPHRAVVHASVAAVDPAVTVRQTDAD